MVGVISYLSLGANLGAPAKNMGLALRQLRSWPELTQLAVSSLLRGPYVGAGAAQPEYWNAVARIECALAPEEILSRAQRLQRQFDPAGRAKDAPRYLDIDLLLYGDFCCDHAQLQLPHPRLRRRRFVLEPLFELAPELSLPTDGARLRELLASAEIQGQELHVVATGPWWEEGVLACAK